MPALIVLVVVSVWVMFTWLVHRTSAQPEDLIQGLQGSSVARWQRASELAGMLSDKRYADFQTSSAAATKLADILDREIDAAKSSEEGMQQEAVTLRYFLCRALGEFRVPDGLNVLLKAAATNRDPREEEVRRGAIQAIAVRASNLAQLQPPQLAQRSRAGADAISARWRPGRTGPFRNGLHSWPRSARRPASSGSKPCSATPSPTPATTQPLRSPSTAT